jgi:hypothetical protein
LIFYLAAKGASIGGVLGDFLLFHLFSEGGTVTGTVFTDNTDFLGSFGL